MASEGSTSGNAEATNEKKPMPKPSKCSNKILPRRYGDVLSSVVLPYDRRSFLAAKANIARKKQAVDTLGKALKSIWRRRLPFANIGHEVLAMHFQLLQARQDLLEARRHASLLKYEYRSRQEIKRWVDGRTEPLEKDQDNQGLKIVPFCETEEVCTRDIRRFVGVSKAEATMERLKNWATEQGWTSKFGVRSSDEEEESSEEEEDSLESNRKIEKGEGSHQSVRMEN